MQYYIKPEKIRPAKIAKELYDFSKPGVISIHDVLTPKALEELAEAALLNSHIFREVPRYEGTAEQDMKVLYIEKFKESELTFESLPIFALFRQEYARIYAEIAREAHFNEPDFNKVGFHKYPKGSFGITPHQDYTHHINLISVFNLVGDASFFHCQDTSKRESYKLDASPGSLILLRAARNKNEERFRPFHYVECAESERLSLNVRKKVKM